MLKNLYSIYKYPIWIAMLILAISVGYYGAIAINVLIFLAIFEITMSFDNAILNAQVLKEMNETWRKIFLFLGILIAVFGVRLILPSSIVSTLTDLTFIESMQLSIDNPDLYKTHLEYAQPKINIFGGTFLICIMLNFLLGPKENHWLKFESWLELSKYDTFNKVLSTTVIPLILVLVFSLNNIELLIPGICGVVVYQAINIAKNLIETFSEESHLSGLINFLYLEVLDASLSFDGVIGAFAITDNIILIMLGLAIGAFFVRTMTIHIVETGIVDEFIFLEHGANYAIGILGILMLLSINYHISEAITGLSAITIIGLSFWSSIRFNKINQIDEHTVI